MRNDVVVVSCVGGAFILREFAFRVKVEVKVSPGGGMSTVER
jgi:hypothetical protein